MICSGRYVAVTVTLEESGCAFETAKLCDASFRQSYTPFTKVPPRGFMLSQASGTMSSCAPTAAAAHSATAINGHDLLVFILENRYLKMTIVPWAKQMEAMPLRTAKCAFSVTSVPPAVTTRAVDGKGLAAAEPSTRGMRSV